jgi:hypothetical protein
MARRLKVRFIALLLLSAFVAAFLVDRIALYSWGSSVLRQFQRYRQSVSPSAISRPSVSITEATELPLWMGPTESPRSHTADPYRNRADLFLSLEPGFARPALVFVKGRVIELVYLPPSLAWTTRIFPLRPRGLPYRMYRPKDYYGYRIDADFSSDSLPVFKIYRVVQFEAHELPAHTRNPRLFP